MARASACLCPRMSYMWYLICYTLSRNLPSPYKWNADASTYVFLPVNEGCMLCTIAEDSKLKELLKIIDQEDDSTPIVPSKRRNARSIDIVSDFPFAIKVMQLCNAAGNSCRPCIIIAVKSSSRHIFRI